MKRFWIGVTLLAVLLVGGLLLRHRMDRVHLETSRLLQQAQTAALQKDWPQAQALAEEARQQWQRYRRFTAAFADHTPMDEIDGLFAELAIFSQEQEMPHFAATCTRLNHLASAMAESHMLHWWNLL